MRIISPHIFFLSIFQNKFLGNLGESDAAEAKTKCLHYTAMIGLGLFFTSRLLYRGVLEL